MLRHGPHHHPLVQRQRQLQQGHHQLRRDDRGVQGGGGLHLPPNGGRGKHSVECQHHKDDLQVGGFIALILGVSFMDLVRILDLVQTKIVEGLSGKNIVNSMFQ